MKKKVLTILLGLCIVLSGCGKEVGNTNEIVSLPPLEEVKKEETVQKPIEQKEPVVEKEPQQDIEEEVVPIITPTIVGDTPVENKPKPTTPIKEEVEGPIVEVEPEQEPVDYVTAEDILEGVRNNIPSNYRMEYNLFTTVMDIDSEVKYYCDITDTYRHDITSIKEGSTSLAQVSQTWYNLPKGEIHLYSDNTWDSIQIGKKFNPIDSIIKSVEYCKFVDSDRDGYTAIQAHFKETELGYNTKITKQDGVIYINGDTNNISRIDFELSGENERKGFTKYESYILFGLYGNTEVSLPEQLSATYRAPDGATALSSAIGKLGNNYSVTIRNNIFSYELRLTDGNRYMKINSSSLGIGECDEYFYDSSINKSFRIHTRSDATGQKEILEEFDSAFVYMDMVAYLSKISNFRNTEVNNVTDWCYNAEVQSATVSSTYPDFVLSGGDHLVRISESTGDIVEVSTDTEYIGFNNIGSTSVELPDNFKMRFPDYYE